MGAGQAGGGEERRAEAMCATVLYQAPEAEHGDLTKDGDDELAHRQYPEDYSFGHLG